MMKAIDNGDVSKHSFTVYFDFVNAFKFVGSHILGQFLGKTAAVQQYWTYSTVDYIHR